MSILTLNDLTVSIGNRLVCDKLSLALEEQQVVGILGRNGVGKTTLLNTIMGFHQQTRGEVIYNGKPVQGMARAELARHIGILFQENQHDMPATVLETALLGRHPHNRNFLWDDPDDIGLTTRILARLGLESLLERPVTTLSGGEKQRLAIAVLMAQSPQLSLLDEPSNHLDIDFQIRVLALLKESLASGNSAIMLATHDINLAARFCNRILLMLENGQWFFDTTDKVLTEENLSRAYNCPIGCAQIANNHYFFPL